MQSLEQQEMKMSRISEILSDEHKIILKAIDGLTNKYKEIESGKKIDEDFFRQMIDFIRNYADKFHHAKEEDILFKELCKGDVEMHCNPVDQMLYEHELGRGFVKGMEDGLAEKNKNKIIENAKAYALLLQEHIFKEDNILYPIAERVLNKELKEKITKMFLEIEKKKKEKYLVFVNGIK